MTARLERRFRALAPALVLAAMVGLPPATCAQTQQELDRAMQEMQRAMKDPEFKKMMEQMGVKPPVVPGGAVPGAAPATGAGGLPPRDAARLASVRRTPPSAAELATHLQAVHAAVERRMKPAQRDAAQKILARLKAHSGPGDPVAATANAAWVSGAAELALYLMGRACLDNPKSADNLNNYAAFLVMTGAEPQALPILLRLAADYPNNSTVRNNLGQAWFGLGEIKEAEEQLKRATAIFAAHSQANATLATIEESRGNTKAAAERLKLSLSRGYSSDKERRLRRLGERVTTRDLAWTIHEPEDPLGLHRFIPPEFCKQPRDAACNAAWKGFNQDLQRTSNALSAQLKTLMRQREQSPGMQLASKPNATLAEQMQAAQMMAIANRQPPFAAKARKWFDALIEESRRKPIFGNDLWLARMQQLEALDRETERKYEAQVAAVSQQFRGQFGEGKANPIEAACAALRGPHAERLRELNDRREKLAQELLPLHKRMLGEEAYWSKYLLSDLDFEIRKAEVKLKFLGYLGSLGNTDSPLTWGTNCGQAQPAQSSFKLQDFYDLKCEHIVDLWTPYGTVSVRCNKITARWDASFGTFGLSGEYTENLDTGRIVRGTVEIGAGIGTDAGDKGPIAVELGAKGGVFIEFDSSGVTDVGVDVDAGAGVGAQGRDAAVTAGIDARLGWNATGAVTTKGAIGPLELSK